MGGMPITELPQTFHDAIEVCRALNIRYLWIDSLCIIQNDHQVRMTREVLIEKSKKHTSTRKGSKSRMVIICIMFIFANVCLTQAKTGPAVDIQCP